MTCDDNYYDPYNPFKGLTSVAEHEANELAAAEQQIASDKLLLDECLDVFGLIADPHRAIVKTDRDMALDMIAKLKNRGA